LAIECCSEADSLTWPFHLKAVRYIGTTLGLDVGVRYHDLSSSPLGWMVQNPNLMFQRQMATVAVAVASSSSSSVAATASSFGPSGSVGRRTGFTSSCFASSAAAFATWDSSLEQEVAGLGQPTRVVEHQKLSYYCLRPAFSWNLSSSYSSIPAKCYSHSNPLSARLY